MGENQRMLSMWYVNRRGANSPSRIPELVDHRMSPKPRRIDDLPLSVVALTQTSNTGTYD